MYLDELVERNKKNIITFIKFTESLSHLDHKIVSDISKWESDDCYDLEDIIDGFGMYASEPELEELKRLLIEYSDSFYLKKTYYMYERSHDDLIELKDALKRIVK